MDEFIKNITESYKKIFKKGSPAVLFLVPAAVVSCFTLLILLIIQNNNVIVIDPDQENSESSLWKILVGENREEIFVEIADSDSEQTAGLMFRNNLPENQGMLFIFKEEEIRSFWMKNTYISLDIIFLNSEKEVINFYESAEPLNETKKYISASPCKYVLEVNGGWSKNHSLEEGDKIEFDF